MKVLALEPYYGGSHRAFIDGWIAHSRHSWQLLHLPAHKWKWRMRHAPLTMSQQLAELKSQQFDCVVASDMLDVVAWRGLASKPIARRPLLLYFHENQLTYPVREDDPRDLHFGLTNILSAAAADAVWFNSAFHRTTFLDAAAALLHRMPDYQPTELPDQISAKSQVHPPGLSLSPATRQPSNGPLRILWAARWEHDKNPEMFFDAMRRLRHTGASFTLSVVGEQFDEVPDCFDRARHEFADHIVHWGYQPSRRAYEQVLYESDLFVSTADHEFFGIAAAEAMLAGCRPLLPDRLAYPDLLSGVDPSLRDELLYDGTVDDLVRRLDTLTSSSTADRRWREIVDACTVLLSGLQWDRLAPQYDDHLEAMASA